MYTALLDHLDAIGRAIIADPAGAITSAKDLVETMYKLILDKRGVTHGPREDLPGLYKKVADELSLTRSRCPAARRAARPRT